MNLLLKILWGKQSKWQFMFAGLGFAVGLLVMLISLQLYFDVNNLLKEKDKTYLIVTKQIAPFQSEASSYFEEEKIKLLEESEHVVGIAPFEMSNFEVDMKFQVRSGFKLDFFMEAIPDSFIEDIPKEFAWEPERINEEDPELPFIMSASLYRLYNSSIAFLNKDLPQASKGLVSTIKFRVVLKGNGHTDTLSGRVVGFSERVPTFVVPLDFIQWANSYYGDGPSGKVAKYMVSVQDPKDNELANFLDENKLEANSEQVRAKQTAQILSVIVSITGGVGILFVLLSFVIFIINFQLVISRAKQEINLLINLGYTFQSISKILNLQFAAILGALTVGVFMLMLVVLFRIYGFVESTGFNIDGGISPYLYLAALFSLILMLVINAITVRVTLRS